MSHNKEDMRKEIINRIIVNRISTTEVADCLGKTGALQGIRPINRGLFRVGEVFLAYAYNGSNWELHEQLQDAVEGSVILVETYNCGERAAFGDLVSKYLTLYKRASAIVVNGYMRDAHRLLKENYPVWCKGVTPIGCHNKKNEAGLDPPVVNAWRKQYQGAIAICDDGGVVIIPPESINEEFLEKLNFIELQEDIWYYCVDTKKWSTYEAVCLKNYLNTELLPDELRRRFDEFTQKTQ